jgi:hypothetical protein
MAAGGAAMFLPLALCTYLSLQLHGLTFGAGDRHYKVARIVEKEFKYVETGQMTQQPAQRTARLLRQWLLYNFSAPLPTIATWSHPRDHREFISITHMETNILHWPWWQIPFLLAHGAMLALLVLVARWRWDLAPIAAGLAFQFLLHFAYGREFVIYAPNWHPLLAVFMVALVPAAVYTLRGPLVALVVGAYAILMAAGNAGVMESVFHMYQTDFPVEEARAIIEMPE